MSLYGRAPSRRRRRDLDVLIERYVLFLFGGDLMMYNAEYTAMLISCIDLDLTCYVHDTFVGGSSIAQIITDVVVQCFSSIRLK